MTALAKTDREPWGRVVLEGETRLCAFCDCAVYLAKNRERQCCWCGVTYVVVGGQPVKTGVCMLANGDMPGEQQAGGTDGTE